MATRLVEKEHLSAKGLIAKVRNVFKKVKEPFKGSQGTRHYSRGCVIIEWPTPTLSFML